MQHSGIYSLRGDRSSTRRRARRASSPATPSTSRYANMIASGDRNASTRAIREIVYRATHSLEGGLERLLHRRAAAVLVPEHRHAGPRQRRLSERRQHARHPGLHADDAGLGVALLRADAATRRVLAPTATTTLKAVANYVKTNIATTGNAAGLVYNLFGGDQLLPVRDHRLAGADALRLHVQQQRRAHDPQRARGRHAARARRRPRARSASPRTRAVFDGWADDLAATINAKLRAARRPLHRRPELGGRQPADRQHRAARADLPDLLRRRARGQRARRSPTTSPPRA